jgi:hypothetical protein
MPCREDVEELYALLSAELAELMANWAGRPAGPLRITKGRVRSTSLCPAQVLGEVVDVRVGQELALGIICDIAAGQFAVHPKMSVEAGWYQRLESAVRQERPEVAVFVDGLDSAQRHELFAEIDERCAKLPDQLGVLLAHRPTVRERARVDFPGPRVVLAAEIDLAVGPVGERVLCEVKSGHFGPWLAEEVRHYGLVVSLRDMASPKLGCAAALADDLPTPIPLRLEDLEHAATRVLQAAEVLVDIDRSIAARKAVRTTPGEHCRWCARAPDCPDVSDLVRAELETIRLDTSDIDDDF